MFLDPRVVKFFCLVKFFCYTVPVDCRKSHNGLVQLAKEFMPEKIRTGSLFVFFSKDRKTVKVLQWDGSGIVIFHKKLERGRFFSINDSDIKKDLEKLKYSQ